MRRKLTGTLFYGVCLAAIAILILALVALLLLNVLVEGVPWPSVDFLTGVPSRRPANAGIWPALIGSIELAIIVAALTFPLGIGAAVYLAKYAPGQQVHATDADEHQQPGRRAVDHLRGSSASPSSSGCWVLARRCSRPLPRLRWSSCRSSSSPASRPSRPSPRPSARAPTPSARASGRWSRFRSPGRRPRDHDRDHPRHGTRHRGGRATRRRRRCDLRPGAAPKPFEGGFTVLPIQIFNWAQRPQEAFQGIAAATIIVVLVLIFILNLLALVVRARLSRHIQW